MYDYTKINLKIESIIHKRCKTKRAHSIFPDWIHAKKSIFIARNEGSIDVWLTDFKKSQKKCETAHPLTPPKKTNRTRIKRKSCKVFPLSVSCSSCSYCGIASSYAIWLHSTMETDQTEPISTVWELKFSNGSPFLRSNSYLAEEKIRRCSFRFVFAINCL